MGILNKLSKRCIFCKTKGNTEYIPAFGIYGKARPGHHFHSQCLLAVINTPQSFKSTTVDMAIDIIDRIEEQREKESKRIACLKEKYKKLKQFKFQL